MLIPLKGLGGGIPRAFETLTAFKRVEVNVANVTDGILMSTKIIIPLVTIIYYFYKFN
jgi:hypothetical protein